MPPNAAGHASANEHPECYGSMFPSVLNLGEDRPASGTVFSVKLERAGGMYPEQSLRHGRPHAVGRLP